MGKQKEVSHQAHGGHKRAVTTAEKGGYIAVVQTIYGVLSTPLEDHHKTIDNLMLSSK